MTVHRSQTEHHQLLDSTHQSATSSDGPTISNTQNYPINDIAFLVRSEHRVTALNALAEQPQSRADLRALTEASSATIGRLLRTFEERHWISREGHQYTATSLGVFVASSVIDLLDRMILEQKLRPVIQWLPTDASGFTIEMVTDAVVTVTDLGDPYRPASRAIELFRETDQFRGFNASLVAPPTIDEIHHQIRNEMETEIILSSSTIRNFRSTYPRQAADMLESDSLTLGWCDDLPRYGLGLFDDRIAISVYDPDNGALKAFIDTDEQEAYTWAESIYEPYRRKAQLLDSTQMVT